MPGDPAVKRWVFKKAPAFAPRAQENEWRWPPRWAMKSLGSQAIICCPSCRAEHSLTTHRIDKNGDVNPSAVCPNSNCDFHYFITLDRWEAPGEAA